MLTANFPALSGAEGSKSKARAPAPEHRHAATKVCNHVELMRDKFPEMILIRSGADDARLVRCFRFWGVNAHDVVPRRRRRDGRPDAVFMITRESTPSSRRRPSRAGGDRTEALLQGSGKLALLDRMLLKLKEAKARVLSSRR